MNTPFSLRFRQAPRCARRNAWVLAVAMALLLAGCPPFTVPTIFEEIAARPGNVGLETRSFGGEAMVSLAQGNLILTMPATSAERVTSLGEFFDEYREFFGLNDGAKAETLSFSQAAPEQQMVHGGTVVEQYVVLYQEHAGALVIDEPLYGIFQQAAAGPGSELRRVRGQLRAPSGFPSPPALNEANMAEAEELFEAFLAERNMAGGSMSYLKTPVILGEKGVAGFLATYTEGGAEEAKGVLHAVVNPILGMVYLYDNIPACNAG